MFWYPQFVYVTALFPYVILLTLLVRAATLPGFLDGVTYYITPQWGRILDFNVSYLYISRVKNLVQRV